MNWWSEGAEMIVSFSTIINLIDMLLPYLGNNSVRTWSLLRGNAWVGGYKPPNKVITTQWRPGSNTKLYLFKQNKQL